VHRYEIDEEQERFVRPDLSDDRRLDTPRYIARGQLPARPERLPDRFQVAAYRDQLNGNRP
jgi:hypothetical protein